MADPKKVFVYIDGYNVYHTLKKILGKESDRSTVNSIKRVDIMSLLGIYIKKPNKEIGNVYYFSAYCSWDNEKKEKHKWYVKNLQSSGVIPIMGEFKKGDKTFHKKNNPILEIRHSENGNDNNIPKYIRYESYSEKRTDVNLAIQMVNDGLLGLYDEAIIFSSDTDMIPAIEMVRKARPNTEFGYMYIKHELINTSYVLKKICKPEYKILIERIKENHFEYSDYTN